MWPAVSAIVFPDYDKYAPLFYKYLSLQKQWSGIKYIKKITKTEQISHVMSTDDETNQQMLSERHWSRLICVSYINSN